MHFSIVFFFVGALVVRYLGDEHVTGDVGGNNRTEQNSTQVSF
jgi:hypothetical protein